MNKPTTLYGILSTLLLLLAVTLVLEVGAQPAPIPTVTAITPNTGPADRQTAVVISGQGFVLTSTARLDATPLLAVTFVDSTTLNARVPFGLPTGVYTLTVTNAQGGALTRAYTVTAGAGGWSSNGPYGGGTRDLAIHPTLTGTVYVAAEQAGLYRTTDGGLTWEQVLYSSAAPVGFVRVWPADPDVVFFGREDGLYRSAAGGDPGTWAPVAFPGQAGAQPSDLAIAAGDPDTLYCATGNSLFYSADGGATWIERGAGLPGVPWHLAASPDDAATAYASYQDGTLYKTADAGQSWAALPFSVPPTPDGQGGIWVLATDPYRPDTVWVGTWMQGLHRSTDGGQTFSEVDALYTVGHQSGFWSISFDPNQDRIFVGVSGPNDAVYYSDDGGNSWHGLGLNNQGGADIAVTPGNSDTIYTTWAGVRKSTDGGLTWTWLAEGISAIRPWRIAVSPHDPDRVLTVADADGAFGTHNAGNEWVTYPISASGESHQYEAVAFDPVSPTTLYVGGTETVFKTTDDGQSWQPTADMPVDGLPPTYERARPLDLAVHPQDHETVFAGVSFFHLGAETINEGALYRSDNGGDTWTLVTATGPISPVQRIALAPTDADVIYLGTGSACHWCAGDGIWRSRDGGLTWEHPQSEVSGRRVLALAVHPADADTLLAGVWSESNTGLDIYRSTDGGDSWQATSGLHDFQELEVPDLVYHPTDPRFAYAATYGGLRVSLDGGLHWQPYPGPMGQLPVTALAIVQDGDDVRLYVGTVGGLVGGGTAAGQAIQEESLLGAGVYVRQGRWYLLHLPLMLRGSP